MHTEERGGVDWRFHRNYWTDLLRRHWPAVVVFAVLIIVLMSRGSTPEPDPPKKQERGPWVVVGGSGKRSMYPSRDQMERAGWVEPRTKNVRIVD